MARKKQRNIHSGWDAVLRAAARTGHHAALRISPEGGLIKDTRGRRDLARLLAQGIVCIRAIGAELTATRHGLSCKTARDANELLDIPLHEDIQGATELAAIAWRELRDPDAGTPLDKLVPVPHNDPVVAMKLSAKRIAELESAGACPPPLPIDDADARVWYVELDSRYASDPRAIVRWRTLDASGKRAGTRMVAIWTDKPHASFHEPMLLSMSWMDQSSAAMAGAMPWPLFDGRRDPELFPDTDQFLQAQQGRLRQHLIPVVLHRAIQTWTAAEGAGRATSASGFRRELGRLPGARNITDSAALAADQDALAQRLLQAPLVRLAPCPYGAQALTDALPAPATALDAAMMAAARTADQSAPVGLMQTHDNRRLALWNEQWWARAEQAMVLWHVTLSPVQPGEMADDRHRQVGGDLADILNRPAPMAIKAATYFIGKILKQTGRAQVLKSPHEGTIHGIKVPPRLWRALGEAGPRPDLPDLFTDNRWWYVEIEDPAEHEPDGVAVWMHIYANGSRKEIGFGIWTRGPDITAANPLLGAWILPTDPADPERGFGWARLDVTPHAPGSPGPGLPQALTDQYNKLVRDTVETARRDIRGRAFAAIAEHLTRGTIEPLTLADPVFQEATGEAGPPADNSTDPKRPPEAADSMFQLVRAPDPVVSDASRRGGNGAGAHGTELTERQYVKAHYKRQVHGPQQSLRRIICVEGYWRGPEPDAEHVPLERLAEQPPSAKG